MSVCQRDGIQSSAESTGLISAPIHTPLARQELWNHCLLSAVLLTVGWDCSLESETNSHEQHKPNENKIPPECRNIHEVGRRSAMLGCQTLLFPREDAVRAGSAQHRLMKWGALTPSAAQKNTYLFFVFFTCSTSHPRCWWSLWQISPGEWNTSAARTSSTETLLPATACKLDPPPSRFTRVSCVPSLFLSVVTMCVAINI